MAKNDFDIDFDFEKEYGFDPKAILDSDYTEEDLDLSQFDDDAMDIDLDREPERDFDDFDLDGLGLDDEEDVRDDYREARYAAEPEDVDADDLDDLDFDRDDEDDYPDDVDLTADMDFSRRASFFGVPEEENVPAYNAPAYEEPAYEEPVYESSAYEAPAREPQEEPYESEEPLEEPKPRRERRPKAEKKPVKLAMPPVFGKLVKLYFPDQQEIAARMEAGETRDGRRRRRPSKAQIFKEFYLPTVILGLAAVLVLSFVIGSLSNAIDRAKEERLAAEQLAQEESLAAEQLASEAEMLMAQAEVLAKGYNYQEAVDLLDTYQGEMTQEMTLKKSEYMNAKSSLVEHQDPTLIPNLSFHVLIHDMNRAMADDDDLAGSYNRNFVSTSEFTKILEQLYANNYVLVDYDSFISSNSVDGTSASLFPVSIWLPEGKKPVMITETMVNYFEYMIDGNDDGKPDSGGDGFASRLVVDANGDIKAEYVDENNVTQTGNFDLVPILEDFIAQHPDFSYKGARATLAVSGSQGIFGYRIQSETIANKGQDYYNEQVVGATQVVERLKELGYRLACYSFDNKDYKNISADQVNQDLQKWKSQISPVIGELDTIVFARGGDIGDYTGGKFDVLQAAGFKIMVKSADAPYTEINTNYVRQSRLMVTGENMQWKSTMFTDNGLFDPNAVLDLASRGGSVPTG